jgi:hypothetical protein
MEFISADAKDPVCIGKHMLHNTGIEELELVCFFASDTSLDNYKLCEDVDFPDAQEEN